MTDVSTEMKVGPEPAKDIRTDMRDNAHDIAAISDDLDPGSEIVVCIPSFRRPGHLAVTLQSLVDQRTGRRFAIVVVDNDAAGREATGVVRGFFQSGTLHGLCIVEPAQGNCSAINAAFGTALARFPAATMFLMIDDDEVASPDWLERMAAAADASGADIVGGPVWPNFDDARKTALSRHPAFRPAYHRNGAVPMIYGSGNCLITRSAFDRVPDSRFDLRFNFLGGGDTDFFTRCKHTGLRFYWAADAMITETVPAIRTRPRWMVTRGLRIGAINYLVQAKAAQTPRLRALLLAKMLASLPLSLVRAGHLAVTERTFSIAVHPIMVALGSALAAVGVEPQAYKASNVTP